MIERLVENLTIKQEAFFNEMERAILENNIRLYNSHDRAWGKTTIINEIGFTYQALGYTLFILSPCKVDYYVCKSISKIEDLRGIKRDNLIVLVDEELSSSELFVEVENFCSKFSVPMVGFVKYS